MKSLIKIKIADLRNKESKKLRELKEQLKIHNSHRKSQAIKRDKGFNLDIARGLGKRKDQVLKNCVNSDLGLHVFKMAFKDKQEVLK